MPRRVFLTGGAGFVGGAVARQLRAIGDDVVAVVRDPSTAGPLRDIGTKIVEGDLRSIDAIREAMARCDAVRAGGRRPPGLRFPTTMLRIGSRLAPNGGALINQPPNLAEIVRSSLGVTYWATSAKAEAELGYRSRPLSVGAVDAFGPA